MAEELSRYPPEIQDLFQKARQGELRAHTELSIRYFYGEGVPIDYQIALSYCKTEDAFTQFLYAQAYSDGKGRPKDRPLSQSLQTSALAGLEPLSQVGDPLASLLIGKAFLLKHPPDCATAQSYFERSIHNGSALALADLGKLLVASPRPGENQVGLALLQNAADSKSASALHELARQCRKRSDENGEIEFLERAAKLQNPAAMTELALIDLLSGRKQKGVALLNEAVRCWENDPEALCLLAYCHYFGEGTPQDPEKAFQLALKAANNRSAEACILVGILYQSGQGIPKNTASAYTWTLLGIGLGARHPLCLKMRAALETQLTREQITNAQAAAKRFAIP